LPTLLQHRKIAGISHMAQYPVGGNFGQGRLRPSRSKNCKPAGAATPAR
jgi:hypothetical protein